MSAATVIASYPKSGRTWLRFAVTKYWEFLEGITAENVYENQAQVDQQFGIAWEHLLGRPKYSATEIARADMSHPEFGKLTGADRAVLLVRNARSTLTSYYKWCTARLGIFSGSPSEFLNDESVGFPKLVSFYKDWIGRWSEAIPETHVLSYDTCLQHPARELKRLLEIIGLEPSIDLVQRAAEASSFDNMRALSTSDAYRGTPMAPGDTALPDSFKIRRADPNEPAELFNAQELDEINRVIRGQLAVGHPATEALLGCDAMITRSA
ncbi:MAG: sulfotransferase domain-containing protein [Planctomycetota bacterium]